MKIRFSDKECRALKNTFGSWDWSGRPRDAYSGDEHYQRVHALVAYRGDAGILDTGNWPTLSVRLLISLIRSTLAKPDHSHSCKTQYRKAVRRKKVRAALKLRIRELIQFIPIVDALADLA